MCFQVRTCGPISKIFTAGGNFQFSSNDCVARSAFNVLFFCGLLVCCTLFDVGVVYVLCVVCKPYSLYRLPVVGVMQWSSSCRVEQSWGGGGRGRKRIAVSCLRRATFATHTRPCCLIRQLAYMGYSPLYHAVVVMCVDCPLDAADTPPPPQPTPQRRWPRVIIPLIRVSPTVRSRCLVASLRR